MVMKVVPLLTAAALITNSLPVRAESSCEAVTRLTDLAERALKTLHSPATVSKSALQAAARDLEIATNASRGCSDRDAKLHLAAVKSMLSDMLLEISDTAPFRH